VTVEILALAFGAVVAAGLLIFILQPIWESSVFVGNTVPLPDDDLDELYAQRDAIYEALKELKMDYETGKISEEDYRQFSTKLKRQAADILRKIDEFPTMEAGIIQQLEQRIAEIRQSLPQMQTVPSPMSAAATVSLSSQDASSGPRFCTQCGAPLRPGDRFCSQCGAPVQRR